MGLGGALGSMGRYLFSLAASNRFGSSFPWGTLGVNSLGCLIMGILASFGWEADHPRRLFLITGILGGFTTFSAFGGDTWSLLSSSGVSRALLNVAANLGLGLAATGAGLALGRLLPR